MADKKAWTQVGTIRMGDKGLYIKFHANKEKDGNYSSANLSTLAEAIQNAGDKGLSLQIETPQDKVTRLAALGFIDEDKVESRLESIPDFIRYEIALPPQD